MTRLSRIHDTTTQGRNAELVGIKDLYPEKRKASVRFRVIHIEEERQVMSRKWGAMHRLSKAAVADSSARITLVLWNHDIDEIEVGRSYLLQNGDVTVYDESLQLSKGRFGEFVEIEDDIGEINDSINMSRPFAWRKPKRKGPRSKDGRSLRGVSGRETKGYCRWKGF